jgi:putative ABC transport system ATP-binding protein
MLIRCIKVSKTYKLNSTELEVLKNIDLQIEKGNFVAVYGPSGSGKSTLMNILGCLDVPTSGKYFLEEKEINSLSMRELASIRNTKIGFVFQNFNLLARYNVYQNIELPLIYAGLSKKERERRVMEAIEKVGLMHRIKHHPAELSGGECQRVAIARALVNNPSIILADEPTGNLDTKRGKEILSLFKELNKTGNTIVMVTHDLNVASYAKMVINICDGEIKGIKYNKK